MKNSALGKMVNSRWDLVLLPVGHLVRIKGLGKESTVVLECSVSL